MDEVAELKSLQRKIRLAYCAGIVDGEGCLFIHCGDVTTNTRAQGIKSYRQRLQHLIVGMADKEPLNFLSETFGGDVNPFKRQGKLHYRWVLCSDKAAVAVTEMLPFLQGKKDQAELFLEFHAVRKSISFKHNVDDSLLVLIEQKMKDIRKVPFLEEIDPPATTEREDSPLKVEGCDSLNTSGNEPGESAEMTDRLN